jgi:uncharacterized protein
MDSVVFDTVIFVRSLINPDGLWGQVVFVHAQRYRLIISPPIISEILEVLTRSHISRKYRGLATRNIQRILGILATAAVVEVDEIPAVSRDPKDDKFLATAVAGNADYLVSEDRDLLDIGTYQGIRIITAREFIGLIREEQAA